MDAPARHLRSGPVLAASLLLVSAGVATVSAVMGQGTALGCALVVYYLADAALYRTDDEAVARWFARREMAAVDRALFREGIALAGWMLIARPSAGLVLVAVAAIGAVQATHTGYRWLSARNRRLRRGRVHWVNLDLRGRTEGPDVLPPTLPVIAGIGGARVVLYLDVLVLAGLWAGWALGSGIPVVAALVAVTLGAGLVAWRALTRRRLILSLPSPADEGAALREAVQRHAPQVVVYFSGGVGTTYQLNVWLETIGRLHQPAVIVLRERHHLDELLPTSTPVLVLPRAVDVEAFQLPSIRVALYPTTVIKNNHMIRLRGIRHVFINHGDGDKSVTSSPLHRVFDEIWVAGQAACDRYLRRGEGVRAEQLVTVGRPQLAHIETMRSPTASSGGPFTVLYAPTWEGNFDGVDYSSVAPMGEQIVDTLLDPALGLRVLFKAHPATGSRLPAAAAARAAIEERIRSSGGPHEVVGTEPDSLYRAFNEADLLVADISSVVADFLASRKPYLVTDPRGTGAAAYHAEFPSTAGGGVVAPGAANLREALRDAVGEDRLRTRREELATYFLGEPLDDPVEHFADEVDRAIGRSRDRGNASHVGTEAPL